MRIDFQNAILLVLCLALLLTVFSISALATDSFVILPLSTSVSTSVEIASNSTYAYKARSTSSEDIYVFSYRLNNTLQYVFVSASSNQNVTVDYWRANAVSPELTNSYSPSLLDAATNLYYISIVYNNSTSYVSSYGSLAEGLSAVSEAINNPATSGLSLSYSLPPGNAIYIQVPQGSSYTLKTRMPESVLGSNHYPGNNQAITLVQSLPSGGTAPTSPLIPWQQDGALSVLGLSRNATYQGTNASAGYLCIVNPLYYSGTANGPYEFLSNGSIDISVDTQTGFVVYPLDSSLGFTSGLGINVDTSILDNPYTGEIDPETGEIIWQDSNGGTTAPTTGGGNLVSTSETIFDFLRNIGDEISTFLKGPIQAIQVVVSAIRDFLSSFTQLYMWLPSPVYNLITSALMIALTIGVVKIFV